MRKQKSLSFKNMVRKPARTAVLVIVSLFLSFSILAGTLVISGLRSGLSSLETRLGADIMVVPYEATTHSDFSDMLLQGSIVSFYMDRSKMDEIAALDGIGEISEQFYLATASASCCSSRIQIIGYNPETDFTITPWIKNSYNKDLGYLEVLVGNDMNAFPGDTLKFYGVEVKVAAKLDRTGTYYDTSVFANEETIKTLIQNAKDTKMIDFGDISPDDIVSCVMINVADGYTVEDVVNDINLHVSKVKAIQTDAFVTDISSGMTKISRIIGLLVVAVWILAIVILMLSFVLISNERKKEFAVLRVLGASRKKLSSILMKEAVMINCIGGIVGAVLAVLLVELFRSVIESSLNLPFLLPAFPNLVLLLLGAILVSVAAGSVAALASAMRISRVDPALILRGDN